MENNDSLIHLIERQIQIENVNVRESSEKEKRTNSAVAKLLLSIIRSDSRKHAHILEGILKLLKEVPNSKTSWEHKVDEYIGPVLARSELEGHLERESQMIVLLKDKMKRTDDEGIKFLLQHILDDERKHHQILEVVRKQLYKIR